VLTRRIEEMGLEVGDAKSSLGDAMSSLGDAKSSLGDTKSSLGDAKSSLGEAMSSLVTLILLVIHSGGGLLVVHGHAALWVGDALGLRFGLRADDPLRHGHRQHPRRDPVPPLARQRRAVDAVCPSLCTVRKRFRTVLRDHLGVTCSALLLSWCGQGSGGAGRIELLVLAVWTELESRGGVSYTAASHDSAYSCTTL
jgi:hypothetical protein